MIQVFNKTSIGYRHIKENKPCQDFSAIYKDVGRIIVTCCDGHGGDIYIRSGVGSMLASCAIINVFNTLSSFKLTRLNEVELTNKIRLDILCEWNKLVEKDLSNHHIKKSEVVNLDEDKIDVLHINPIKAYGTTLAGAMLLANKLLIVSIGDSEVIGISKGELIKIFDDEDEPVGNITCSMCQEDAYNHLKVKLVDFNKLDGIILCSDGLSGPYQSYENLNNSFVKPLMSTILSNTSLNKIDEFVENLASNLGNGDDVSLSFIIDDKAKSKYYKIDNYEL